MKPKPLQRLPAICTFSFFTKPIITPAKARKYMAILKKSFFSATKMPVIVVPMLAPIMMGTACIRVITPAFTRPMTITEVAEELWIMAVTAAPMPTPEKRLPQILPSSFFIPEPALFSSASLIKFIPTIKIPTPASSQIILCKSCIISSGVNMLFYPFFWQISRRTPPHSARKLPQGQQPQ